jgi:hypothetical protein
MRSCIMMFCLSLVLVSTAPAQDTVHVYQGWNLIGSVMDGTVPEVLTTVPGGIIVTAMFGYAPGAGYVSGDSLHTGYGYWVKVSADGLIVFNNAPVPDACLASAFNYQGKFYHTV